VFVVIRQSLSLSSIRYVEVVVVAVCVFEISCVYVVSSLFRFLFLSFLQERYRDDLLLVPEDTLSLKRMNVILLAIDECQFVASQEDEILTSMSSPSAAASTAASTWGAIWY